jgi:hypothetical protein
MSFLMGPYETLKKGRKKQRGVPHMKESHRLSGAGDSPPDSQ